MSWLYRCFAAICLYASLLPVTGAFEAPLEISGVTTVNVQEARSLYEQGAVFIDVRSEEEWNIGHIHGALHLDFQRDFGKLYYATNIEKNTPLVIYCNGIDCLRSAYACSVSIFWGFTEVYYFRSGYFAWMLEDYPVVMGVTASLDAAVGCKRQAASCKRQAISSSY